MSYSRCAGHVSAEAIDRRSWAGGVDSWVSDEESARDARRCRRRAAEVVDGYGFCRQHAPIYRTHFAIVERIRKLPTRLPTPPSDSAT